MDFVFCRSTSIEELYIAGRTLISTDRTRVSPQFLGRADRLWSRSSWWEMRVE